MIEQFERQFGKSPEAVHLVGSRAEKVLSNPGLDVSRSDIDFFIQTDIQGISKHQGAGFEFFRAVNPGKVPEGVTGIGVKPGQALIGEEIPKPGIVDPFFGVADELMLDMPTMKLY